jgi:hypothetical protein
VNIDELSYGFRMTLMDAMVEKAKSKREAARIRKAFKAGLEPSSPIPDGIVDFLKQNSPFAKVDYIDCLMRPYRERYI